MEGRHSYYYYWRPWLSCYKLARSLGITYVPVSGMASEGSIGMGEGTATTTGDLLVELAIIASFLVLVYL